MFPIVRVRMEITINLANASLVLVAELDDDCGVIHVPRAIPRAGDNLGIRVIAIEKVKVHRVGLVVIAPCLSAVQIYRPHAFNAVFGSCQLTRSNGRYARDFWCSFRHGALCHAGF